MEGVTINWLAVIVAAISSFIVGGIWYGPLFGRAWMAALHITEEDMGRRNMPRGPLINSDRSLAFRRRH